MTVTMAAEYTVVTQAIVNIQITSTASEFPVEKRYQKDVTIGALKGKLEMITGATASSMRLSLYDKDNKLVCPIDNDAAMLGSYPVEDGMRIHVVDPSMKLGQFEDVSKVEKFELSEEEYAKKRDSVRAFKERNKMGRFREVDPEEEKLKEQETERILAEERALCDNMKIADRCEVSVPGQSARRGTVRYLGEADFKPGYWVGVQYDEPLGKNDGSVAGKRYFTCPAKYGGFVKPQHVKVGDFPEEDLNFSDDEI